MRGVLAIAAAAFVLALPFSSARAGGTEGGGARVIKGPYLQVLGTSTVEIRAELDVPAPVVVRVTDGSDAGAPRVVRDATVSTMHLVRIDGLRPSTRYSYTLAVGSSPDAPSAVAGELTTAPPNDSKEPFSFLVYGDNRTDAASHAAIVRLILQSPADFLLNTGDLVQEGFSDANWQTFFDVEGPLLRSRNLFACVGNHELTDGAGASYLRYFGPTCDAHGDQGKPKLYGSFRWATARFFLLDAMESFEAGPERAWLDDELGRADAEPGLVWRIAVMHHSPWSSGPHGGNARALRAGLPALFAAHHIDLVIAGHDHIYERGIASGLRYVVSGGGGAPLYEIEHKLASARKAESVHHVVEVTVDHDAMRLVTKRDDGSLIERCGFRAGQTQAPEWDCDRPQATVSEAPKVSSPPLAAKRGCSVVGVGAASREPFEGLAVLGACGLLAVRTIRRRRDVPTG